MIRPWRKTRHLKSHAMHPAGRIGTPEDIGNFIAFSCSENGGLINGVNVVIDGGLTTKLHH